MPVWRLISASSACSLQPAKQRARSLPSLPNQIDALGFASWCAGQGMEWNLLCDAPPPSWRLILETGLMAKLSDTRATPFLEGPVHEPLEPPRSLRYKPLAAAACTCENEAAMAIARRGGFVFQAARRSSSSRSSSSRASKSRFL
jgi:hypothetical protein